MEGTELEATPCSNLDCRYVRAHRIYPSPIPFRVC
jgi:hypothetical protein